MECGNCRMRYRVKRHPVIWTYCGVFVVLLLLFYVCASIFNFPDTGCNTYCRIPLCILSICCANLVAYYSKAKIFTLISYVWKLASYFPLTAFLHDIWITENLWTCIPNVLQSILTVIRIDNNLVFKSISGVLASIGLFGWFKDVSKVKEMVPCSSWNVYNVGELRAHVYYLNVITSVYSFWIAYVMQGYSHMFYPVSGLALLITLSVFYLLHKSEFQAWRIQVLVNRLMVRAANLPCAVKRLRNRYYNLLICDHIGKTEKTTYFAIMREVNKLIGSRNTISEISRLMKVIEALFSQYLCHKGDTVCCTQSSECLSMLAIVVGMGCTPTTVYGVPSFKQNVRIVREMLSTIKVCNVIKAYLITGLSAGTMLSINCVTEQYKDDIVSATNDCLLFLSKNMEKISTSDYNNIHDYLQKYKKVIEDDKVSANLAIAKHLKLDQPLQSYDEIVNNLATLFLSQLAVRRMAK